MSNGTTDNPGIISRMFKVLVLARAIARDTGIGYGQRL